MTVTGLDPSLTSNKVTDLKWLLGENDPAYSSKM